MAAFDAFLEELQIAPENETRVRAAADNRDDLLNAPPDDLEELLEASEWKTLAWREFLRKLEAARARYGIGAVPPPLTDPSAGTIPQQRPARPPVRARLASRVHVACGAAAASAGAAYRIAIRLLFQRETFLF